VQAARLVYIGNLEALAISWVFIKRQNIYSTQSHTQQEVEQQANPCKYRIYSQHTQHIQQGVLTICNSSLPFNLSNINRCVLFRSSPVTVLVSQA
jgi:hypothetical protein